MSDLQNEECLTCKGDTPALKGSDLIALLERLGNGWTVVQEQHLEKQYRFQNFREALAFTNQIGELAEAQNHHPDLHLAWGKVGVTLWTHSVNGLTKSDFVMAAKIEALDTPVKPS